MDATDTRARLIEVAVDLFTRNSFAGTSLQMIADDWDSPKPRSTTTSGPANNSCSRCSSRCSTSCEPWSNPPRPSAPPHARAEQMLTGYAALAVRNRGLVGVLAADPSVATALAERADWGADHAPALAARRRRPWTCRRGQGGDGVRRDGWAAGPLSAGLGDDELQTYLIDAGRRNSGRASRRARSGKGN